MIPLSATQSDIAVEHFVVGLSRVPGSRTADDEHRGSELAGTEKPVAVAYRGAEWHLRPGDVLTIGRSPRCHVRLPEDDHLSRHAATLRVMQDWVLVRNDSATKPLVLRPPVGEDRVVEPGSATASLPYGCFSVVFSGHGGTSVLVGVDASTMSHHGRPRDVVTASGKATATVTAPVPFTPAQSRVLTALCAPMLTRSGPGAVPASCRQIADRLGLKQNYVRNVLKAVRESLSGYGIPGLIAADEAGDDFRWALARCALRNGWVGERDVAGLPPEPGSIR